MKKIDKIDMFIFVCIMLSCGLGIVQIVLEWITGEEVAFMKLLVAFSFSITSVMLMSAFTTDIIAKIINNHKEKKNNEKK